MINIKIRVANIVRKHGTARPYELAHCLGINVIPVDLPLHIRGFLVRVLRRKIIILNDRLPEESANVVLCHELGHARLHTGYGYYFHPNQTYYVPSKREREANEFAVHLLSYCHDIDAGVVAKIINSNRPNPAVIHKILSELSSYH